MHETVLASSLLKILQESVATYKPAYRLEYRPRYRAEPLLCIKEVVLSVGLLACVEPQTLRGCFEIMAEGTVAEGAGLTIIMRPMKGRCPDCGRAVETSKRHFSCPLCQGEHVDWQGGQGMEITSIRVAEMPPPQI